MTQYCHVDGSAGTEHYILELARALRAQGAESTIGWLCGPQPPPDVSGDSFTIIPIPSPAARTDAPEAAFESLLQEKLLGPHRPDVAHFHTFGLAEQRAAALFRQEGIPVVFTYHSPAWSCRRQTMMLWGDAPCDGEVKTLRCAACKLQQRTGCSPLSGYAGALLSGLASAPLNCLPAGALRRRAAFFDETRRFRKAWRHFVQDCHTIVSCAEWSIPVLERNGARPDRIQHLPQGVPQPFLDVATSAPPERAISDNFVIGYVGRVTPLKGTHIIVDAFMRCDYPRARLRLLGWEADEHSQGYAESINQKIRQDPRIETEPKRSFHDMVAAYRDFSLVAIPSTWLETGPLVLLEALALGLPVWGSTNIGQMSLLEDFGRVIDPNSEDAWEAAFQQAFRLHAEGKWTGLARSPHTEGRLKSMAQVAQSMTDIYENALRGDVS